MTTILALPGSGRRCDATCHDAIGAECDCVCGGLYHALTTAGALRKIATDLAYLDAKQARAVLVQAGAAPGAVPPTTTQLELGLRVDRVKAEKQPKQKRTSVRVGEQARLL